MERAAQLTGRRARLWSRWIRFGVTGTWEEAALDGGHEHDAAQGKITGALECPERWPEGNERAGKVGDGKAFQIGGLHLREGRYYRQDDSQEDEATDMTGETIPANDEEAAIEAAMERCAIPPLRDVLRREYDEILKGRPRDVALEKWGPEIEGADMAGSG
jgi:hypothetical protein